MKHQFNFQAIRPASGDAPLWKVKLNQVVNLNAIYPLSDYQSSTDEFITKTHLFWTFNGKEQDIKLKVTSGSFDIVRELKQHDIATADNLPEAEAQKFKYTLEIQFKDLNKRMLRYVAMVQDAIKYHFYSKLTTTLPTDSNDNKIQVAIELLPQWEQMNIIVKTPRENSYISDAPFYWNPFVATREKVRYHDLPISSWLNRTEEKYYDTVLYKNVPVSRDECVLNFRDRKVTTFDGVEMQVNPLFLSHMEKGCWGLLTQDISQQSLFTVISKRSTNGRTFKWLVPKYDIELIVRGDRVSVKVNDVEKPLRLSQPIIIREENDEASSKQLKIERLDKDLVELKAYELGMSMVIDIESMLTKITVSPMSMLQGQLAGLCGNNNQDQSDEVDMPYDIRVPRTHRVLLKHVVPSDTCIIDPSTFDEDN
jgi:hypothetical protein